MSMFVRYIKSVIALVQEPWYIKSACIMSLTTGEQLKTGTLVCNREPLYQRVCVPNHAYHVDSSFFQFKAKVCNEGRALLVISAYFAHDREIP